MGGEEADTQGTGVVREGISERQMVSDLRPGSMWNQGQIRIGARCLS